MDSRQPELSRLTLMCSDHEVAEFTWNHDRQAVTGKTHVLDAAHAPLMATDPSGNITAGCCVVPSPVWANAVNGEMRLDPVMAAMVAAVTVRRATPFGA